MNKLLHHARRGLSLLAGPGLLMVFAIGLQLRSLITLR